MCIYCIQSIMLLIITWKYWSILTPLCTVSFKALKKFLYNNSCDWFVPNYCLNCMTFYSIYFGSARVLLPHAELHHLSTSINGRRRYRLDQSTPSLAAIVRRISTQCRRPHTPPRKLPRSSHESSHARLALYPPRTSHFTITQTVLLWVISGCADVSVKDGCADNSCYIHYQSWKLLSFSIIRFVVNCSADAV